MLVSRYAALAIVIAASPAILLAQVVDSAASRTASAKQRNIPIINNGDRHLGVVLAATVVALVPFDAAIGRAARQPALQNNSTFRETAVQLNRAAFPGATFASYAVYAAGVSTANEQTLDAGFHILESVFVASNVTDVLKRAVGRARPSVSSDPLRFDVGNDEGTTASASFPSGHATVAFALAAASAAELSHHGVPGARFIIPVLYGTATGVGTARVYGRAHWASDVVAGAAVGMFSARAVVRTAHAHPGNWLDAFAVHGVVAAEGRGRALLGWHTEAP
jgi:membrane-associated phospholipid phosphatase